MSKTQRKELEKMLLVGIIWEYMMDNPGEVELISRITKEEIHLIFNF